MAKTTRAVGEYLAEKRSTGAICAKTEAQQRGILYGFAEHMPVPAANIKRRDVLRWLGTLSHLSANSRRLYHLAAKHFTDWLQKRRYLGRDPFDSISVPKATRPIHRCLDPEQVRRLLGACETNRDRVLVLVALHTGVRRAELAALEVGDVSLSGRTVTVRQGKGGHDRTVPLSPEAVRIIAAYIAEEALSEGPLLRSLRYPQQGISGATVGRVFRELAYRAGVKIRSRDGVATHATRHTFATTVHEETSDVMAVQQLLGHASLQHTARYVGAMNVEKLRPAVEGLSFLGPRSVPSMGTGAGGAA